MLQVFFSKRREKEIKWTKLCFISLDTTYVEKMIFIFWEKRFNRKSKKKPNFTFRNY